MSPHFPVRSFILPGAHFQSRTNQVGTDEREDADPSRTAARQSRMKRIVTRTAAGGALAAAANSSHGDVR
jgi:hypothetical protein